MLEFPVQFALGPLLIPAHPIFEFGGMMAGFQLFLRERRLRGDPFSLATRMPLFLGTVISALIGSKLGHHLSEPSRFVERAGHWLHWTEGRSIVGALVFGWIGVEAMKRALGIRQSTGDLYAIPLCVGIAIGRIGCFLTGLEDATHGIPTDLFLGIDFGDGIRRHSPPLYEIAFLCALALWLRHQRAHKPVPGLLFRQFLCAYLGFRFLVDFLKPYEALFGLQGLQWLCLATLLHHGLRWRSYQRAPEISK